MSTSTLRTLTVLNLLFVISLNSFAQVNWVSGGIDALNPNTVRFHCLDTWIKAGENIDVRAGFGGVSLLPNPNQNQVRRTIEFWHLGPGGLSYGLGNGFAIEGSLEVIFEPGWNDAFLVDNDDIGWVPGLRTVTTSQHLALNKIIPVEDWGCLSLRIGLRSCGGIDIYEDYEYLVGQGIRDWNYLGRFAPYSTGFFAQASFGVGNWRNFRGNTSRPLRNPRPKPQVPSPKPVKTTRTSQSTFNKSKGQVSFTEGSLELDVQNVFVIQGKGKSCSNKNVESGLLDVVGTQLLSTYTVLERQMLDVILEEQRLSMSGLVFEATAVEAGCLQGADGVVFCQYGCLGEDDLLTIKLVDCKTSSQIWVLSAINTPPLEAIQQLSRELK